MLSPQDSNDSSGWISKVFGAVAFFLTAVAGYILKRQGKQSRPTKDLSVHDYVLLKGELKGELLVDLSALQNLEFKRMHDTLRQINDNLLADISGIRGDVNSLRIEVNDMNERLGSFEGLLRALKNRLSQAGSSV